MTDRELLNCLTDRPCDVCKFHGENGCSQWTCVFCDGLFGDMRTKQETSGDLISRQAVEKIINDIRDCISVEGYWAIIERMKKLSSVNPQEPKTGCWEYGYAFADGKYGKCSECKELIKCIYPMHYCPNCGARMQESEDKE